MLFYCMLFHSEGATKKLKSFFPDTLSYDCCEATMQFEIFPQVTPL